MRYTQKCYDRVVETLQSDHEDLLIVEKPRERYAEFLVLPFLGNTLMAGQKNRVYERIGCLIHEYGHYLSWTRKDFTASDVYRRYLRREHLSKNQLRLVLEEERRAWRYGFAKLRSIGVPVSPKLLTFRDGRLRHHRHRMRRFWKDAP